MLTRLPPSGAASAYSTRQGCAERADELAAAHDGTCCFMMARAEECVIQLAIDTGAYEVGVCCCFILNFVKVKGETLLLCSFEGEYFCWPLKLCQHLTFWI